MKNIIVWKLVERSLRDKIPVMLLYVLESSGSSPGRQGFFMAVNRNGEMEGSIGGGIMEHKFVEMGKEKLRSNTADLPDIRKQVHDKSVAKNQSGMICSGEQTILLYHVQKEETNTIAELISSLQSNKNGTITLSPRGIQFESKIPAFDFEFIMQSEEDWIYREKTGYKNELFIIGGGHCSLALSAIMRSMDFYIRLYESREELKTMVENNSVHEKHLINDYTVLDSLISAGKNKYVVIMTFGYRTDDAAVRSLMNKDFRFIGLLGSKTKIGKMFDDYRKEGIDEKLLTRIHTPVGIQINSQTPEEIAVSIAAEIIQVKNK